MVANIGTTCAEFTVQQQFSSCPGSAVTSASRQSRGGVSRWCRAAASIGSRGCCWFHGAEGAARLGGGDAGHSCRECWMTGEAIAVVTMGTTLLLWDCRSQSAPAVDKKLPTEDLAWNASTSSPVAGDIRNGRTIVQGGRKPPTSRCAATTSRCRWIASPPSRSRLRPLRPFPP